MKKLHRFACELLVALVCLCATSIASAQITINEVVVNQRNYGGTVADTDEFMELYNAGNSTIDLSGWTLISTNLGAAQPGNTTALYTIPGGYSIAPGGYFVIGAASVPNVSWTPAGGEANGELFADDLGRVYELRNNSSATIDAIAYDVWNGSSALGLTNATAAQVAQVGSGYNARLYSFVTPLYDPYNKVNSWGRYRDGRDSNSNGRDFGFMPLTPGTTNNVLPISSKHSVPNVDGVAALTPVTQYHGSFLVPRVIDPTVADLANPKSIAPSPQGGNAIVAWDPTGGGNSVYSEELVNKFDIFAHFTPTHYGISGNGQQYEISAYGIGTTDARFAIANPLGSITGASVTENASTGLGWYFQKHQVNGATTAKLLLIDFGDGGNSVASAGQWTIKHEIDMTGAAAGWHRLGIDYNPATGAYSARYDDQVFNFSTTTDLMGTFYVGYREQITVTTPFSLFSPPIFDLVESGDFDGDGDVDGADFISWQTNYPTNSGATAAMGDANNDGDVDGADFAAWQTGFTSGSPGSSPVPEPTTAISFATAIAALGVVAYRRRYAMPKSK
jgi:hypothetical protein